MILTDKLDLDFTPFPICPYCGEEEPDVCGISDATNLTCGSCGKVFYVEPETSITFTTRRLEDDPSC